jgi:hypothetical protein
LRAMDVAVDGARVLRIFRNEESWQVPIHGS